MRVFGDQRGVGSDQNKWRWGVLGVQRGPDKVWEESEYKVTRAERT